MRPLARRPRAFTLLELVLAATILGLLSLAVMGVFRAGTRAYSDTGRDMIMMQRARYIMDSLEEDLARVVYLDETGYNNNARLRIEQYQRDALEAELTNDWRAFEDRYGPRDDREEELNDPNYVGNPFEQGKLIDLQFVGIDGGDQDSITFAVLQPVQIGSPYLVWGLARVEYTLHNGVLVRSVESIEAPPRDWEGDVLPKEQPADHVIIAEGVTQLDLEYSFWFDGQWLETEAWTSGDRTTRNSRTLLGEYDEQELERFSQTVGLESTEEWNSLVNDLDNEPLNRLPATVRVTLGVADPINPARTRQFTRIFRLHNSQETYIPNGELDEDQMEMELDERLAANTPVFPGASEEP